MQKASGHYNIEILKPEDVELVFNQLEKPNWAPWLRYSPSNFTEMVTVFPDGQLVVKDGNLPIAILSSQRIDWDGNVDTLPASWDEVNGGSITSASFKDAYVQNGNTIVVLNMGVDHKYRGLQLPGMLVSRLKELAQGFRVKYIIGPFRPSEYGEYKLKNGDPGFQTYCEMKREDGLPVDGWLRNMVRQSTQLLRAKDQSMVVTVPRSTFEEYKRTYHLDKWREVSPNKWECGEAGKWSVSGETATYSESSFWGKIQL